MAKIDNMMDQVTIVNYAKTKMNNNIKNAEKWFFSPCVQLQNRRPVDVLHEDLDGFKQCISALDERESLLH